MKTIKDKHIEIDDYKLFCRFISDSDYLNQPVIVFLHDSWGCTEMWGEYPEKLSSLFHMNVLVYDRRGYGKSSPFSDKKRTKDYLNEEVDTLILLMNKVGIEKAILYGHSDGGTIALIAAASYPNRFAGIMVESSHSFMEEQGVQTVKDSRDRAQHNSLLKSLAKFHGANTEELFKRWHETWLDGEFADWSIVPLLKKINCPVLALRGENDPFDTEEQINILLAEIQAPIVSQIISNAAHTPRRENEAETISLIQKYINLFFPLKTI